jgi:hypothetical protein
MARSGIVALTRGEQVKKNNKEKINKNSKEKITTK